jgi:hypothetical protein
MQYVLLFAGTGEFARDLEAAGPARIGGARNRCTIAKTA